MSNPKGECPVCGKRCPLCNPPEQDAKAISRAELQEIARTCTPHHGHLVPDDDPFVDEFDPDARPVEEVLAEIVKDVPREEWDRLDAAERAEALRRLS